MEKIVAAVLHAAKIQIVMQSARCWLAVLPHEILQIDRAKLMRDDPLLYRELQDICTLCPNKRDRASNLSNEFEGMRWECGIVN
jgi:hypothetical protein